MAFPALGAIDEQISREVIYETERTRITRFDRSDGVGPLIHKAHLGPGAWERTKHELRILGRLSGAPGVVQVVAGGVDEIVMDDVGGRPLTELIAAGGLDGPVLWQLAVELAHIVGEVHRRAVVHADINPANILVVGATEPSDPPRPVLIDFHLATTFVERVPGFSHLREIVGTLPYLAPEQTGRTGAAVDDRADLYGLGATLYELATGVPPFEVADPLRMVHDTLTRVPVPPADRDARVSWQFSQIVLRLLEKEPDRRYQSAEGLLHDLSRLLVGHRAGGGTAFDLAQRDFPRRLSAPSRLVGRDHEVAALRTAFDTALAGGARGVLVAGASGVGKTVLINGLRAAVTERGGWFVTGKFDQYRQGAADGAVTQALRGLGRLLLAGDDAEVADVRSRIVAAVDGNLAMLAGLPEFTALLGLDPAPGDPAAAGGRAADEATPAGDPRELAARMQQVVVGVLAAVVSGRRPVVVVIDDLQWATSTSITMIDAILTDPRLAGVLLVGAYRDGEVTATHPLTAAQTRWHEFGAVPTVLRLANLPAADLGELLGEMLRLPGTEAGALAEAVGARTGGNPFDTVELVNALRRDGALVVGETGWRWDAPTIRRFVGQGDVISLLTARIDRLAADSRALLELMACLGGVVPLDLLCAAAARPTGPVNELLIAPLEDGLLVWEQREQPVIRFRHDRVQQAAHGQVGGARRAELHLLLARRLAGAPRYAPLAAEQYLHCVDVLVGTAEARPAAGLFLAAAAGVRIVNPVAADRFLSAAATLLADSPDDPVAREAQLLHHLVLYGLGRLVEADAVYAAIERRGGEPTALVGPACVQIATLTNRGRPQEGVALGLALLARLGVEVPDDFAAVSARQYGEFVAWSATLDLAADLSRPEADEGSVRATVALVNAVVTPAHFCGPTIAEWLALLGARLWVAHGPSAPMVAHLSTAVGTTLSLGQDYRSGYLIGKHVLAVGEARGYEPATSFARNILSMGALHWFEPLEQGVRQARQALDGLIRGGDLQTATFTHFSSLPLLLDCAVSLDACAADVESGFAFAARTGNDFAVAVGVAFRQLVRALRGETAAPGSFDDADFAEATHLVALSENPLAAFYFHVYRAVGAALFGDVAALIGHAAPAAALKQFFPGLYPAALAYLVQGLSLAQQIRAASPTDRPALLAELDACQQWLAARGVDAPGNFGHLSTLLVAERAWALDDRWAAAEAYDAARQQVATRSRRWHQALITERSAAFHLAVGLSQTGQDQLAEALRGYATWSATAKVAQLERDHPFLRASVGRQPAGRTSSVQQSMHVSSQELDLLAILRSSQALSSQTSPEALRDRVGEVLGAMTGATSVLIVLHDDESADWLLWDTTGGSAYGTPLAGAAALAPLSAFRYAERTGEPLSVPDAGADERFTHDPYLKDLPRCSLLAVPMLSHGTLRGMLLLINRSRVGAFAADGLEAVLLVVGQLTVSFDNAQLYASLERKVQERTTALERANLSLEALSNTDALTGLPNRRQFDATLRSQWRLAEAQGTAMGLVMIDVDHFKLFNDHYGHVAGDECLRRVAGALGTVLRDRVDTACRYGGEEFAIILPGADGSGCARVAERVCEAVAALHHPHVASGFGQVTISVGIAAYDPAAPDETAPVTPAELVATADLGLYAAKEQGRNRVGTPSRP